MEIASSPALRGSRNDGIFIQSDYKYNNRHCEESRLGRDDEAIFKTNQVQNKKAPRFPALTSEAFAKEVAKAGRL